MAQTDHCRKSSALVVLLTASLAVVLRWHIILSAEAPSPGAGALLKIVWVGLFFNQVLPTGVGGDVVRAWRCRKIGIGWGRRFGVFSSIERVDISF
jgi:uncharacterized membrane protein YbhN (UPF0104 family)